MFYLVILLKKTANCIFYFMLQTQHVTSYALLYHFLTLHKYKQINSKQDEIQISSECCYNDIIFHKKLKHSHFFMFKILLQFFLSFHNLYKQEESHRKIINLSVFKMTYENRFRF